MVAKMINQNKNRATRALISDNYENFAKSKRSQVTIFIIIALMIVVMIAMIFVIWRKPVISISPEADPQAYIEKCTRDSVIKSLDILSPRGGSINPVNYKLYEEIPRRFLCFNQNYYHSCINQEPMLIEHIEKEITSYIELEVKACFSSLKQELEKRSYEIDEGTIDIEIELKTKKVLVTLNKKFQIKKNEETREFKQFKAQIIHPIYDLANIALEITNQESKYCNFEYIGHMVFYPQYKIEKFVAGDSAKIYTITEKSSDKKFVFAVRSCVVPPGF